MTAHGTLVRQAQEFLATVESGQTRSEIAANLWRAVPGLREDLIDRLLTRWVWEQMRAMKDEHQLPLFGVHPPEGSIITGDGAIVQRREAWDRRRWRTQIKRWVSSRDKLQRLIDAGMEEYRRIFGEQLELFS